MRKCTPALNMHSIMAFNVYTRRHLPYRRWCWGAARRGRASSPASPSHLCSRYRNLRRKSEFNLYYDLEKRVDKQTAPLIYNICTFIVLNREEVAVGQIVYQITEINAGRKRETVLVSKGKSLSRKLSEISLKRICLSILSFGIELFGLLKSTERVLREKTLWSSAC